MIEKLKKIRAVKKPYLDTYEYFNLDASQEEDNDNAPYYQEEGR